MTLEKRAVEDQEKDEMVTEEEVRQMIGFTLKFKQNKIHENETWHSGK